MQEILNKSYNFCIAAKTGISNHKKLVVALFIIIIAITSAMPALGLEQVFFDGRTYHEGADVAAMSNEGILKEIALATTNIDGSLLNKSLAEYNNRLFSFSKKVSEHVVLPLGLLLLSLFALLDLQSIVTSRDNLMGETGVEIPFRLMLTYIIAYIVISKSNILMTGIFDAGLWLIKSLGTMSADTTISTSDAIAGVTKVAESINELSPMDRMKTWIILLICYLISKAACLISLVTILARFLSVFLLIAIAPIPLATLTSHEHSQIGKNFIKRFSAECLQGFLLALALYFYPYLFTMPKNADGDINGWLMTCVTNAVLLIIVVRTTNSLARSVVQAN